MEEWIRAAAASIRHSLGNARFLTHWASPRIEPTSSQRQHPVLNLLSYNKNSILVLNLPSVLINSLILQREKVFIRMCFFFFFFWLFFFWLFRATPVACGSSQARGQIKAAAAGLHHSHSKAGFLTHWVGPGIEPTSSWILVRFITTKPQQELKKKKKKAYFKSICNLDNHKML